MAGKPDQLAILDVDEKTRPCKEVRPQDRARNVGKAERMADVRRQRGQTELDGPLTKRLDGSPVGGNEVG